MEKSSQNGVLGTYFLALNLEFFYKTIAFISLIFLLFKIDVQAI